MGISVVINTYNASKHLRDVLESVKSFDEIVVCDMESTDDTLEIAREYGCKVATFEKGNYNIVEPARNFAIAQASEPWILVVDADELVTPELREYLYAKIAQPDCPAGLYLSRKNYFMGRFMHGRYPDTILRFFKKEGTHWPPVVHCAPVIDGPVMRVPRNQKELALIHLANDTVADILRKTNDYTRNEVQKRKNREVGMLSLIFRPFSRFFKAYVMKGGFRDGKPGFILAVLDAYYLFVALAKVTEYKENEQNGR